jgi:DNA (cytosine-5)-methyltransferase 1
LKRHRLFEVNWPMMMPGVDACHGLFIAGVYGGGSSDNNHAKNVRRGGYTPHKSVREALIGVPTGAMTLHGLSQSIPPAYTRFIGEQLLDHMAVAA